MTKSVKKIFTALILLVGVFFVYHLAAAAALNVGAQYVAGTGLASTDPRIVAARIIQLFFGLLAIIAIGLIIYGGFLWMTAAGNEEQIDRAKRTLVSAIIGMVIIFSAFGITTFILNSLLQATNGNTGGGNNGGNGQVIGGIGGAGAIGECSVQSVYPVPNQKAVPRNTVILVTFKEAVDPKTICADTDKGVPCCASADSNGNCLAPSAISASAVQIFKSTDGNNAATNAAAHISVTSDDKTYTIRPDQALGSETAFTDYSVALTGSILKSGSADSIFKECQQSAGGFTWQFEVSNLIDLTPPQVAVGGVWPPPDKQQDTPNKVLSVQAKGSIVVNGTPKSFVAASATVKPDDAAFPTAKITVDPNAAASAVIIVSVSKDGVLAAAQIKGGDGLGTSNFSGNSVTFTGKYPFTLTADDAIAAGDEWTVTITAAVQADSLSVGSTIYTFAAAATADNQITVGATKADTAQNIVAALSKQTEVNAAVSPISPNQVILTAAAAGAKGDNILVSATSPDPQVLHTNPMDGGSDGSDAPTQNDKSDQPMNTIIQINFNEPILPTAVAGDSAQVANVIKVVNLADNSIVSGKFVIANQYQTVEFISDKQCGVNGCGEPIYCLPPLSHLAVEIKAASLAPCPADACASIAGYNQCKGGNCQDGKGGNYPQANVAAPDGVTDTAFNSLDGDRDGNAEGPVSYYNENDSTGGDSYEWSFYITDQMDNSAPLVVATLPVNAQGGVLQNQDAEIDFNKLMMASTLVTGSTVISNGQTAVTHKNINLWNAANNPVGYWIETENVLDNGVPVTSNALIKHLDFGDSASYDAQAGSAVRDIHQNCFKPSGDSSSCKGVSEAMPSCCNGVPVQYLDASGDCP